MPITQFVFIRHGETEWNRVQKLQGWRDSSLTALGKHKLAKTNYAGLMKYLAQYHSLPCASALYSSDLGRAMASARLIANRTGHHVISEPRLRERNLGNLESRLPPHIPSAYQHRFEHPLGNRFDVECCSAFERRVLAWLETIAARHPNQTVWVVSHGEWLRTARNLLEGREGWRLGNGIPANGEPILIKMQSAQ